MFYQRVCVPYRGRVTSPDRNELTEVYPLNQFVGYVILLRVHTRWYVKNTIPSASYGIIRDLYLALNNTNDIVCAGGGGTSLTNTLKYFNSTIKKLKKIYFLLRYLLYQHVDLVLPYHTLPMSLKRQNFVLSVLYVTIHPLAPPKQVIKISIGTFRFS